MKRGRKGRGGNRGRGGREVEGGREGKWEEKKGDLCKP